MPFSDFSKVCNYVTVANIKHKWNKELDCPSPTIYKKLIQTIQTFLIVILFLLPSAKSSLNAIEFMVLYGHECGSCKLDGHDKKN